MIQKVNITRVHWGSVNLANGPVEKIGIKTAEHGEKWLSAFESKFNAKALRALKEGQVVDLVITSNGEYLNFRTPSKIDYVEADVQRILKHLGLDTSTTTAVATPKPSTTDEPDW